MGFCFLLGGGIMSAPTYKKTRFPRLKVALFCLRRFLWDPSIWFLFFFFLFCLGLLLFLLISYPKPNGPSSPLDPALLMTKLNSLEALPGAEAEKGYCNYLLSHPLSPRDYALFGCDGLFSERLLSQESWARYLCFLPSLLFPFFALSSFFVFGGKSGKDDEKNLWEARIEQKKVRQGKTLYFCLFSLTVFLLFSFPSLLLPKKEFVLIWSGSEWSLLETGILFGRAYLDCFLHSLALFSLAYFLTPFFQKGLDFELFSASFFLLFTAFAFLSSTFTIPYSAFLPFSNGAFVSYGNQGASLFRLLVPIALSSLFLFAGSKKRNASFQRRSSQKST